MAGNSAHAQAARAETFVPRDRRRPGCPRLLAPPRGSLVPFERAAHPGSTAQRQDAGRGVASSCWRRAGGVKYWTILQPLKGVLTMAKIQGSNELTVALKEFREDEVFLILCPACLYHSYYPDCAAFACPS